MLIVLLSKRLNDMKKHILTFCFLLVAAVCHAGPSTGWKTHQNNYCKNIISIGSTGTNPSGYSGYYHITGTSSKYYEGTTSWNLTASSPYYPTTCEAKATNGIQDLDETGVDCGGTFTPSCFPTCTDFTYSEWSACSLAGQRTRTVLSSSPANCINGTPVLTEACQYEPEQCTNGTKQENEEGIDCGGACPSVCVESCPVGFELYVYGTGVQVRNCEKRISFDALNNCPAGYEKKYVLVNDQWILDHCAYTKAPLKHKEGTGDPLDDSPMISTLTTNTSASETFTNTQSTAAPTTNGPVTTTVTTSSQSVSNYYGSTTSISAIKTVTENSETGEKTETTETSTDIRPPHKYAQSPFDSAVGDVSRFSSRIDQFHTRLQAAPIYAPLRALMSPTIGAGNGSAVVDAGSYGSHSVNLADFASAWSYVRLSLIFCAMWVAVRIVIANK